MTKKWLIVALLLALIRLDALVASENVTPEKMAEEAKKLVKKLDGNRFKLGDIVIDTNKKTVRFPAKVNMDEGLIELLLCAKHGKTHESLFVSDVDAAHLNLALIMIGCKAGNLRINEQGENLIPDGTFVTIEIAYKEADGKENVIRAEDWIFNDKEKKPMAHTNWVYTGSFFSEEGEYMATLTGTYIVTFHDPYTIIDLPLKEGADDTVFWINKNATKKKGFPVELIITAIEPEAKNEETKEKGE
jgi:hypothetical protein